MCPTPRGLVINLKIFGHQSNYLCVGGDRILTSHNYLFLPAEIIYIRGNTSLQQTKQLPARLLPSTRKTECRTKSQFAKILSRCHGAISTPPLVWLQCGITFTIFHLNKQNIRVVIVPEIGLHRLQIPIMWPQHSPVLLFVFILRSLTKEPWLSHLGVEPQPPPPLPYSL